MKLKKFKHILVIAALALLSYQNASSQCFQIESILVDACGVQEGFNEMVRFKVGNANLNTSNLTVSWPTTTVTWQGVIRNSVTATKVATLNGDILDAGGCGQLIEPTGGVLPANSTVILVTSYNFDTDLNSFGALTENIYIIFQNNGADATGHFANNNGTGLRTLTMSFGSCTDSVSYERSLLVNPSGATVAADGAIVLYNPAGNATYINNGCSAPVQPFTVNAGPPTLSACAGTTISLNGTAQGYQSVTWSAPSGTFSSPNSLTTNYTSSASQAGNIIPITLTAINSCGLEISDVINLSLTNSTTPTFNAIPTLCSGTTAPVLSTTSLNGITGTWNPAVVSNTTNGSYLFTPNAGQCATTTTLNVNVSNRITPTFNAIPTICTGSVAPVLSTTSLNGITGTWNPAVVSNTANGTYLFTPNAGHCATTTTLNVSVSNSIIPTFNAIPTICTGSTAPVLSTTSLNGITGTWNPAVVNNTANGSYLFTPNAGQCATTTTLNVNVSNSILPTFNAIPTICTGSTAPVLSTTSLNGITGTWNPAVVSNTANGSYLFTPNAGQCATTTTLNVNVSNSITPTFNAIPTICTGSTAPVLSTTSLNGITGTWSPAVVSNTANGSYLFTPNAGQCATTTTLNVNVSNSITPTFNVIPTLCMGSSAPVLNTSSLNGITGTWNPAVVSNTASASYLFTPNAGQCATTTTLNVSVVSNSITPTFNAIPAFCAGTTAPVLSTTSLNGITGTWNPTVISNTVSGSYLFTPNAGQCATTTTLNVSVTDRTTPTFNTIPTFCTGSTAPTLSTTSLNGITGTWNPAVVSNTASGSYLFTPNAGQCATAATLNVTVNNNNIIPDFETTLSLCDGGLAPNLETTSPNGITGSWNPSTISNTASGSYLFTPNSGQCAASVTLNVTVGNISFAIAEECLDGEFIIKVVPISDSFDVNDVNFEWTNSQGNIVGSNSDLNISDLLNSTQVVEEFPITYHVKVTTAQGCNDTQMKTVYSAFCNIPKGISPNGDSRNDEFDLSGLGVKEITIFDRYGVKVYARRNYTKEWKGQSDQGHELPDATYYYVISKSNGETVTGWVYVNRQRT